jgi:signal transduction histidine kinase/DNA-binding NarL/FixJ family response regulator
MRVHGSGDIMRKAGSTTLILQLVSAVLLFVLIVLFVDISRQFRFLQDGIRENAVWSVYQLDREARALDYSLAELRRQQPSEALLGELSLRYDILYSRTQLVMESKFGDYFSDDPKVVSMLGEIQSQVSGFQAAFDAYALGDMPTAAELESLDEALAALSKTTEDLLIHTNMQLSADRADARDTILELERTSAIMLGLLMISVVFLVVTLRRQLKSVRKAGLELEGMAHRLTEAYEAADAGNRAKSQFMATMGHEIRTPLNAILGMSEVLEFSELPEDALSSVKTIRSSGEALLEVINEILDYSKIEHGKLELEERAVDIRALAGTTVSIIRGRADDHGNTVVLDIPDSLDALYVRTDPTRLRQVLLNLLSNAVKFTSKGTVTLRLREFYRHGKLMLRFEVEDTGIGIDEAGLAKLFKPFSQVDASISRKYGGTGLGLTICKQIVEKLGGELGMSSTVGVGSIFWFELAVVAVGKDEVRRQATGQDKAPLPRLRILLVEDNRVNQMVATRFLDRLGQEVVVAGDGAQAVSIAREQSFDVILMDMQMPVMDGIEATRRIIADGGLCSTTPIIAMTANASDDDRRRCIEAGMAGFESKPVTMERLRNVIHSIVDVPADGQARDMQNDIGLPEPIIIDDMDFPPLSIEGLDDARQSELVEALGEDVFRELVESFFNDATGLIQDLHVALANHDPEKIDRTLHTIKGAAVNVGLNDIADIAHALRSHRPSPADVDKLSGEIETLKFKLVA